MPSGSDLYEDFLDGFYIFVRYSVFCCISSFPPRQPRRSVLIQLDANLHLNQQGVVPPLKLAELDASYPAQPLGTRSGTCLVCLETFGQESDNTPELKVNWMRFTSASSQNPITEPMTSTSPTAQACAPSSETDTNKSSLEETNVENKGKAVDVRVLPCGHVFHAGCIAAWLTGFHGVCPTCRRDLTLKVVDSEI
ncbi:uncharacterized protein SAPINGB_P001481 [Magnusiomyces paraingens]|uniref:RING-type domain-containing protein n=1 Tax=Magnusiomyces paraingens TaxID=2606893 RepID=A0A5E8B5Y4_9ASCO|nr:uncharacterized protein SAPINGB_P001481 [Saprochaete ingens]VVT46976.1 unnamed protein product [Saprochaete ingens]